jgi:acyl-CoA thioester hydrolase
LLHIHTTLKSQTTVKVEFDCKIYNDQQELLTTAHFILVFLDLKTGRPTLPPENILKILNQNTN